MIQVINGQITQYRLSRTGTLSTGESVSGYNILMQSDPILAKQEGWLPLEDIQPEYNQETQYLVSDGYEILEGKVIKKYKVEDMVEEETLPQPSEIDILKAQNKALSDRTDFLEDVIAEMAMMVYD